MKAQLLLCTLFLALISGCGPGQLFGPTNTPQPTQTPTATPIPIIPDSQWKGVISNQAKINFIVTDHKLVSITIGEYESANCRISGIPTNLDKEGLIIDSSSIVGGVPLIQDIKPVEIIEGKFEFSILILSVEKGKELIRGLTWARVTIIGGFTDTEKAKGKIKEDDDCGQYEMNWNATI